MTAEDRPPLHPSFHPVLHGAVRRLRLGGISNASQSAGPWGPEVHSAAREPQAHLSNQRGLVADKQQWHGSSPPSPSPYNGKQQTNITQVDNI